ncbi:MAG: asparagine synthase (glutamine-hydrolyzing) [Alphaproteobacteria bacterium]|nr:asparagine synthase (glutamine-hydrolyzing) [Alphaproteobacteria bacterium]
MCGLAGIVELSGRPLEPEVLQRMTASLAHRGPDGGAIVTGQGFGMGHRRLAVIDLSAASAQPMRSADGRFTLAYNGELYNFRELRAELEAKGVRFTSCGDAEVVLQALITWGAEAISRFNGMFALALWDQARRRLLLARDRYGIKPLYYAHDAHDFIFASEIKALLVHSRRLRQIDKAALVEYLNFQNFFTDRTLYAGVAILPPGHILEIGPEHPQPHLSRYWDYDFREIADERSMDEVVEEFDALFRQAVHRQMVSDVPIGTFLSGGVDTGMIAANAARQRPGMCSFTIGFDLHSASGLELAFDERAPAEHMSYLFGTEHYEMVLKAGDMERAMPRLMRHIEEPRVGQCYPNYYAAQLASKFGKVVLSGVGGDELFGGYPWRYFRSMHSESFDAFANDYFAYWQRIVPADRLERLCAPMGGAQVHASAQDIFRGVFRQPPGTVRGPADYINLCLYFEAKTFLHGLLVIEDKLSMAHGLETRVPFLDNDLVDFAMRLPVRFKLGRLAELIRLDENDPGPKGQRYFDRTNDGKLLVRKASLRYIPQVIAEAHKQGFSGPDASWFRGESINFVRRRFLDGSAAIYEFLDRKTAEDLLADHLEGRENRRLFVWSLLCLEEWCQQVLHMSDTDGLRT